MDELIDESPQESLVPGQINLNSIIDMSGGVCLNESDRHT